LNENMHFNIRMRPNGSLTLFPEQVTKLDLSADKICWKYTGYRT